MPVRTRSALTSPICAFLLFSLMLAQPVFGCGTPAYSPSELKEDKALVDEHWNLFVDIDGFNNTPNAEKEWGGPLVIRWNDTGGSQYFVVLVTSDSLSEAYFSELDNESVEQFNTSVNVTHDQIYMDPYGHILTVFNDDNDVVHVFWERYTQICDVPNYYWIFHAAFDLDGNVVDDTDLFYYEKYGGGMPYPCFTWLIVTLLIVIVASAILVAWIAYKRGESQ